MNEDLSIYLLIHARVSMGTDKILTVCTSTTTVCYVAIAVLEKGDIISFSLVYIWC